MVRRFIGGQLFDVLLDGTMVPIVPVVPSRKLPIWVLSNVIDIQTVVEDFLAAFVLPVVQIPGISLPTNVPPPEVTPEMGVPVPETQPTSTGQIGGLPSSEPPPIQHSMGPIHTRFGDPPDDLVAALQEFWPIDQWTNAAEVSYHESAGWQRTVVADTTDHGPCGTRYYLPSIGGYATTEISVGYFQINICAHGGTIAMWSDTRNNVRKAFELYSSAGNRYTPWYITAGRLGLPR